MSAADAARSPAGNVTGLRATLTAPLYSNAFYLWVSQVGGVLTGLIFWALVARLYGAEDVGLGSAALSLVLLLATISQLGLGLGFIRFLPATDAQRRRLANIIFTTSAVVAGILATVVVVGLPLWAPSLDFLISQPLYSIAFVAFVIGGTISAVQAFAFLAIGRAKFIVIQLTVVSVARIALLVLLAALFGAFGIVAAGGIAILLGGIVGFILLGRGVPSYRPAVVVDPAEIRALLPFSLTNHSAELLLMVPNLVLPLLVLGILGPEQGAYFYLAWFLGYMLSAVSAQLAISLFVEGSIAEGSLDVLRRRALGGAFVLTVTGGLVLLLLGDKLLLVFGRDYADEGTTLLRLMAIAALPAVGINIYIGTLRVLKRNRELVFLAGFLTAATVGLALVLLPLVGLAGAGIGYGAAQGLGLMYIVGKAIFTTEGSAGKRARHLVVALTGRP